MHILLVGADGRGSFEMRGRQLGHAIGARVTNRPSVRDFSWADVIVLVKRAAVVWGAQAKRARVPILWDVVDFWEQPEDNQKPIAELTTQVLSIAQRIGVTTLIGATEAMARDIGGVCLPHQCRTGLIPAAPRLDPNREIIVAYEGRPKYLGPWRKQLEQACADLGYEFVINPPDLRDIDVVVALRGGHWDGEVCRRWKSGVKFANALVAGRPVLTQACAGFDDVKPLGIAITDVGELRAALQALEDRRRAAYDLGLSRADEFRLPTIARRYRDILTTAMRAAA